MSVKCQVIMDAMDKLAPRHLAAEWDNVGLLVGSPAQDIEKIFVTLDVTDLVLAQAAACGANMIISHHPLFFKPLRNLRTDLPQGNLLAAILRQGIAVFAAHTNLDSANGGVNDVLANLLALKNIQRLTTDTTEELFKLVVFVPETHAQIVQDALHKAGAGHIGKYSHCMFITEGTGTFLPLEGTNPFIGQPGKVEHVREVRLETIVPSKFRRRVVHALLKAHPYEEVAYDLYLLSNPGKQYGLGRIGQLEKPVTLRDFAQYVKKRLKTDFVRVAGNSDHLISTAAVCGGSGASLLHKAAFAGADVLITGDIKYHEAQEALSAGISLIDAGHFATEQPVVDVLSEYLLDCAKTSKWSVAIEANNNINNLFSIY
jgi:dinuclear metal center YbgI/SA1388 family protein